MTPVTHELIGRTLEGDSHGIIARCKCGWTSGYHVSSLVASGAFMDHQEAVAIALERKNAELRATGTDKADAWDRLADEARRRAWAEAEVARLRTALESIASLPPLQSVADGIAVTHDAEQRIARDALALTTPPPAAR